MADGSARRDFLKQIGAVGASVSAGALAAPVAAEASAIEQARQTPAAPPVSHAYVFLTPPEAAFVEAAVDRLIPADDLTPSGTDCGVAQFIDRQLGGAWGSGDRLYMQGPWAAGTASQGYQLPMTPAEFFRIGVSAVDAHCGSAFKKAFDRLAREEQIQVLQGLERGTIELAGVSGRQFFETLLDLTMQGFFADPIYGGNRDKVAWKMVGFPGVIAIYSEHIKTYRNRRY